MGKPMALNILRRGIQLYAYNRSKEKLQPLVDEGAIAINSPSEAFDHARIAFSMVSNDEALRSLSTELLKNGKPNSIHVSMSSVSPALSRQLAKEHAEKGVKFLSAPVFGRPEAAAQGKLWFCISGDAEAKAPTEPFLHYMGQSIYDFGDDAGSANMVKITGNFMIAACIELMGEAFAGAERNHIDIQKLNYFLTTSLFSCPIFKIYGDIIAKREYAPPEFHLTLGLKDLNLFEDTTSSLNLPLRDLIRQRLEEFIDKGGGHLDWSAISKASLQQNEPSPKT